MRITIDTDDLVIVPQDIKWVKFKPPMTVVMWKDGIGTTVKCHRDDTFNYETGLLMCIAKRFFGNAGAFNNVLDTWVWNNDELKPKETKKKKTEPAHSEYIKYNEKTIFDNIEVKRDIKDAVRPYITNREKLNIIKASLETYYLPEIFFDALPMPDYLKNNFNMLPDSVKEKTIRPILKIIDDMERAIYEY